MNNLMVLTAACDFPRTPSLLPPAPRIVLSESLPSRSIRLPPISKLLFSFFLPPNNFLSVVVISLYLHLLDTPRQSAYLPLEQTNKNDTKNLASPESQPAHLLQQTNAPPARRQSFVSFASGQHGPHAKLLVIRQTTSLDTALQTQSRLQAPISQ
ncbi:hypothetical protein BDP81DRAFT_425318 [Colletotrichum phormii]|uniref:Uncharacterized protein n=1 Tax=Colletotrichum phormii TaxID=359342 RepID=A0AAI9ZTC4_9PEZI|nr:uncharacterized protein BDP81DRAFT_425318 [Colletotrichum phormii]KAK1637491.1 hypothetical protein BDP81DRAFT_425318 [Colletotrichum phormii]